MTDLPSEMRDAAQSGDATMGDLKVAARGCTACDLYRNATQTVFGEGGEGAELMLAGEQPGDREDIAGHRFVGPAGRLLDEALEAAGRATLAHAARSRISRRVAARRSSWARSL